jgi:hypothetical protein
MQRRRSAKKSVIKNRPKTNKELLQAIRKCAKKLKRTPSFRDLEEVGVTRGVLDNRWGGLQKALAAAGIQAAGTGFRHPGSTLLLDWARVVRKLRRTPAVLEYEKHGRFCHTPLHARYRWPRVPEAFEHYAQEAGVQEEWKDVLKVIAATPKIGKRRQTGTARRSQRQALRRDRPIFGDPLAMPELVHEPVNESGVVFAFGMLARRLGFAVHRIQREFPDCEAVRQIARGQWQLVRIEFEFESRNFVLHKHNPKGCDVIVCWVHNWPECPKRLQVVELSKVAREFAWKQDFLPQMGAESADKKLAANPLQSGTGERETHVEPTLLGKRSTL